MGKKIHSSEVRAGDKIWFSGYSVVVTRIVDGKVYGRFPYTPEEYDLHMFTVSPGLDRVTLLERDGVPTE